jgi:glutathione S-transferase
MSYTVYGSQMSPFVRRIRVLLNNLPYDFKEMNIYEGEDGIKLNKINPVNQIPVFTDGELTIWDSRQIFNYLNSLHRFQNMDWADENSLTAIDGMMNAAVSLVLMKRSGINIDGPLMYVVRQKDRIESILDYLKPYVSGPGLTEWNMHSISIYCFLDWALFRNVIKLDDRPEYIHFLKTHEKRDAVLKTQIPKV